MSTTTRVRYYHGGVPGLRDEILPAQRTGAVSNADYGAGEVCRRDRVYLTTILDAAALYAAGAPSEAPGWVYEVEPVGDLESDTDYLGPDGDSVCARRARIIRVVHRVRPWERRRIMSMLTAAVAQ